MKISTRTRYAVRLLFELAVEYEKGPISLKEISKRQDISEKYLAQLVIPLKSGKLIKSVQGNVGGYQLARKPDEITFQDVFDLMESNKFLVPCLEDSAKCDRYDKCPPVDIWSLISRKIEDVLVSVTLDDLIDIQKKKS